jgi:hypothetical protein
MLPSTTGMATWLDIDLNRHAAMQLCNNGIRYTCIDFNCTGKDRLLAYACADVRIAKSNRPVALDVS